jgi:hypothetical protein
LLWDRWAIKYKRKCAEIEQYLECFPESQSLVM